MATFLLHLDDEGLEALRRAAEAQGRSMNDLACEGLRLVASETERDAQIRGLARRVMSEDSELLRRLGDA
jgi:hypothetical protein